MQRDPDTRCHGPVSVSEGSFDPVVTASLPLVPQLSAHLVWAGLAWGVPVAALVAPTCHTGRGVAAGVGGGWEHPGGGPGGALGSPWGLQLRCAGPCKGGAGWGQPSARGTQLPLRWSPLLNMRTVLVSVFFLKRLGGFEQGLVRLAHVPSGIECWAGWALGLQAVIRALRLVPSELHAGSSWALGGLWLESPLRPFPRLPLPSSL